MSESTEVKNAAKSAVGAAWSAAYDAQVLFQTAEFIEDTSEADCDEVREQVATIPFVADERLDLVLTALEAAEERLQEARPKKGKK
jgi:hypothetical protein